MTHRGMRLDRAVTLVLGALVAPACAGEPRAVPPPGPGEPLAGLTPAQLERFEQGRALFRRGFTPAEGLGPLYVEDRCTSCHDVPASGGSGVEALTVATRWDSVTAACDDLHEQGGPVVQERATAPLARLGVAREPVPRGATVVRLYPPLLYGLGLVEAIPEQTLERLADPDDLDGDGISGRVGRTADGRLGRFGRKASVATIRELVEVALITELGLTNPAYPNEETNGGALLPPGVDPAPDPEVDSAAVSLWTDFIRFLAPPARPVPSSPAERDSIWRGERVFHEIGCSGCHVPALRTGPSAIPALDRKLVPLYSDLLLHDMGVEARGICGAGASRTEVRTARLWGLRWLSSYWADHRASTLYEAILLHGGEGAASREQFTRLGRAAQVYLFKFLNSL
jgi:CxxC motif-containing protein (DUF1111 family)